MKTKNLTGFPFGAKVTSRHGKDPEVTLIVRACYLLAPGKPLALPAGLPLVAQGPLTADTYLEEDVDRAGECLYPGDLADWKPNAEVMLRGTCHTPFGDPLEVCPVRFTVGTWSKTLRVVGRRKWTDDARDARMSKPVPFTSMPVDYAHAFGGSEYAANPVGLGAGSRELPNVEHAGKVIEQRRDDPGPAGFGPVNPAWPQRAVKKGKKYDEEWKRDRSPYYSTDFDWTYFNAAPPDQQLRGYLRGDEKLAFQNLHPDAAMLEVALPGTRVRAFLKDDKGRFREVTMNLDTVFADLDAGKVYLTWRGLDAIRTDDMKDLLFALVVAEKLADAPVSEAQYREQLAAFEADPLELKAKLPGDLLASLHDLEARLPGMLPAAPGLQASVLAAIASAIAVAPQLAVPGAELPKVANDGASLLARPPVPTVALRSGGPPPPAAAKTMQEAVARMKDARASLAAKPAAAGQEKEADPELAAMDARLAEIEKDAGVRSRLDRPAYVEPGPGRDLRGQDYTDRNLRGVDMRNANLTDANLAGANLAGATLAGAKLEAAVLSGADLSEADLTGADLTLANLTGARAHKACFEGATLTRALFKDADLTGVDLRGAKGELVFFPDADLSGADARKVTLQRCFGKGARLTGTNFTEATLVRCLLVEVSAHGVKLTRANLSRTSFARGDLTGAIVDHAKGEGSVWIATTLHDADFTHANLPRALLKETSARRARFRRAVLRDSRAYRASFEQADFTESQLFGIEFTKCALEKARFNGACLYGAKFRQAVGGGCDFTGANMTRVLLEDA